MEPRALRALTWNLELPPGTTLAEDLEKLSLSLERGWEDPKGASSSLHSTAQPEIIINLAEEVLVRDQSCDIDGRRVPNSKTCQFHD